MTRVGPSTRVERDGLREDVLPADRIPPVLYT